MVLGPLLESWYYLTFEVHSPALSIQAMSSAAKGGGFNLNLGTQNAHKHKHFMGISLPCWASL